MRFSTFCVTSIVAILALTQQASSSNVHQLVQDQSEMPIPITFTQNEVVAGGKGKGKGNGKKKDAKKVKIANEEQEEEVQGKDDSLPPLVFKALPDVKRASVVQELANIAKDAQTKKKDMGKKAFEAKAPAEAAVLK